MSERFFLDPSASGERWKNAQWLILLALLWIASIVLWTSLPEWTPPL